MIGNPITWFTHNKTIVNVLILEHHVVLWMWGARITRSKHAVNSGVKLRVDRLLFWARDES